MLSKFVNSVKYRGIKGTIREAALRMLGLENVNEEIDTLFYFLNQTTDISQLPCSNDEDLRTMQLAMLGMIKIFDKLCKEYGLTYWLDYGTLLGAIRHNGFIPWDDDMDIAMPRADYDKILPLLKDKLEAYGFVLRWGGYYDDRGKMARLAMGYKTLETGMWMDIFPVDSISSCEKLENVRDILKSDIQKYKKYYLKIENKVSEAVICEKKNRFFSNIIKGDQEILFHGPEYGYPLYAIMKKENIFPLKTVLFEGYPLSVPKEADLYLRELYGDYMLYPHGGVEHHRDADGQYSKTRAKRNGINMQEIIDYMDKVYHEI